jgi:hypothetical protein
VAERSDLERRLAALGRELDFPPTPDLRGAVRARLRPAPRPRLIPRWALTLAAAVLVALLAVAATPPLRETVAGWLGLPVRIQKTPTPAPSRSPTQTPLPGTTTGEALRLGGRTDLAEARARAGFKLGTPSALGAPDEVYYREPPPRGGVVSLVYRPRPGLPESAQTGVGALLMESRGDIPPFMEKGLGAEARLERVQVQGVSGYWISGKPHDFFYVDADGRNVQDTFRLSGNVLLWARDGVFYRLEANVSREEAIRIASSMP